MKRLSLLLLFGVGALAAGWSPQLAAKYLDDRQEKWAVWPQAQSPNGVCVSCHTGMSYMLARPLLRKMLHESAPTAYETAILERLRANAGTEPKGQLQGVETIFAALFLTQASLSEPAQKAFDQLWALQIRDGRLKGGWPWYSANLDPWETPPSFFYGTAIAALAIGSTPAKLRNSTGVQAMKEYLTSDLENRPLHSRLALLWASTKMPELLGDGDRKAWIAEALQKQAPDGGWTIEALGPWAAHSDAPASSGSNSYATGFSAYVLMKAGVPPSEPALAKALRWLKSHQDPKSGAWPAVSMNKSYPADSMQKDFLQDAATAFASMALIEAGE